jgi:hypothetical protein
MGIKPRTEAVAIWRSKEHRTLFRQGKAPHVSLKHAYEVALRAGRLASRCGRLHPRATLSSSKTFTLTMSIPPQAFGLPSSDSKNGSSRLIDAGKSAKALLDRGGAALSAVPDTLTSARGLRLEPAAVDALLEREHEIGVKHAALAE